MAETVNICKVDVDVSGAGLDLLAASVTNLAAVFESEFGKITKRVNLFGTNVAKRIERIYAAIKDMGASVQSVGTGFGSGVESAASGAVAGLDGFGDSIGKLGSRIGGIGTGLAGVGEGFASIGSGIGGLGGGIDAIGGGIASVGGGFSTAAAGLTELGTALPVAANGFMAMCEALSGVTAYIPQLTIFGVALLALTLMSEGLAVVGGAILNVGNGMLAMSESLVLSATGIAALGAALPLAAEGFMQMLAYLEPVLGYIPQLLIFVATLVVLSLIGEGLAAAGAGLTGIAQGFLAMGMALPVVNAGILALIDGLMNTTINIGGIVAFVLLAASMFVMAIAIGKINAGLDPMVKSLGEMNTIFSVGFIAGIAIFAVMLLLMSMAANKVASGMDKITKSLKQQYQQLLKNIPLLSMAAILQNPIVGAITVAVATAAGVALAATLPMLATGGVASGPTVAMIGEGRYPEAVVPLGSSPQFTNMKNDIANAVLSALTGIGGGSASTGPFEVVLNLDGEKFARAVLPALSRENRRRGVNLRVRGV